MLTTVNFSTLAPAKNSRNNANSEGYTVQPSGKKTSVEYYNYLCRLAALYICVYLAVTSFSSSV